MNLDKPTDDLIERISAINVAPPTDPLDVNEAIRAGNSRRRGRRLAIACAFATVVAASGSLFILPSFGQRGGLPTAGSDTPAPAVAAEQLTGRWIGVDIDAHDVSSWRDASGLPANIIIGADSAPHAWKTNRNCGPLVSGTFELKPDGSFHAVVPPPSFQSCPMTTSVTPDLPDAIARTAHVEVDDPSGSGPRILRFLDGAKQLVASWREDTTVRSATSLCHTALGDQATPAGGFTTVEEIRARAASGSGNKHAVAFPEVPAGSIAVYCRRVEQTTTVTYAVTPEGKKTRL
ncbi:MAG: hypothetical protein QOE51_3896 [Actinoplanes sp.]|jgi:hypothetical protein|nr:hypothetical protein [Actinoplanes sp.]